VRCGNLCCTLLVMAKKLPVLLLLFAACLWAADFWIAKPYTDWNDKEVQKILSDSPWSGKVTVAVGGGGFGGGASKGGGGGGRGGGGRGGAAGPQGDTINPDAPVGAGAGGAAPGAEVTLLWQTAIPVKQAMMKRKFGSEVGASAEAKAFIERPDQVYVLTMVGLPGSLAQAAQGDKKADLLAVTTIEVKGKEPVKATDVQVSMTGMIANLSFLFPRNTNFTADDKEMEFSTKFDKTAVKHKFKLKDMVVNNKVEM
jgi:hypothetical protein